MKWLPWGCWRSRLRIGGIAQLVRACVLYTQCPWFESKYPHQILNESAFCRFFSSKFLLSTLQVLGCYFVPFLHKKWGKKYRFTPINSSVNTLNYFFLLHSVSYFLRSSIARSTFLARSGSSKPKNWRFLASF